MPTCFELGNCPTDNFFSWASAPYQAILGDYTLPLVWGFIVGLIYVKTGKAELTSIVGITLLSGLMSSQSYLNTSSNIFYFWGIALAAVSFGCTMFYLIKVRVQNPI